MNKNNDSFQVTLFAVKEDMGFDDKERKMLLLKKPKIYAICKCNIV